MIKPFGRKKGVRYDFCCNVYDSEKYLGYIRNISISGCLLKSKSDINKKTLNIFIELPHSRIKINTACKIVWAKKDSYGLKFIMDDENQLIQSQLINDLAKAARKF